MQFFTNKQDTQNSCDTNSGCCTPAPKGKKECPSCKQQAKAVLSKTLDALLKDEAKAKLDCLDGFYYCKTPSCSTVYFKDDTTLTQDDVSVVVGLKEKASPATLCYCFEWTKEKIYKDIKETGSTNALKDIKTKMDTIGCSCESLNPSGSCCLGDVTKAIKEIKTSI